MSKLQNKVFLRVASGLLVLLLAVPATQAQEDSFEIGFDFGGFEFDDELGGESEFTGSLRAGYYFSDRFAVEFQFLRATSIFDLELTTYLVNAVYYFGQNQKPYVSLGAGRANLQFNPFFGRSFDDDGVAIKGALGYRFGLGSSDRSGIRLELLAINEGTFDETSTHLGLTAGYSYRFGG